MIMFVTTTREDGTSVTYQRHMKTASLRRNGSCIDLHYVRDGQRKWIGIMRKDLERFLASDDVEQPCMIWIDDVFDVD